MPYSYIDLHCHPSMKPYGKSFSVEPGKNSQNRREKNSIWFYDSPNFFEKAIQLLSASVNSVNPTVLRLHMEMCASFVLLFTQLKGVFSGTNWERN